MRTDFPRARRRALRLGALQLPLAVFAFLLGLAPILRRSYANHLEDLPAITEWVFSPGFVVALAILYGIQLLALAHCRRVDSLHRHVGRLSALGIVFWGVAVLAVMLAVMVPLGSAGEF